jgi:hypothetical protein
VVCWSCWIEFSSSRGKMFENPWYNKFCINFILIIQQTTCPIIIFWSHCTWDLSHFYVFSHSREKRRLFRRVHPSVCTSNLLSACMSAAHTGRNRCHLILGIWNKFCREPPNLLKIGENRALHVETYVSYIVIGDKCTIKSLLYNAFLLLVIFIVNILHWWQWRLSNGNT